MKEKDRQHLKYDKSKRDFLKRSLAISAGMFCLPCESILRGYNPDQKDIYRRIAMYQEETARGIMCRICPNECVLKEGELSQCNNRKVYNSQLYTLAYGNPCSVNVDPVEKKPLFKMGKKLVTTHAMTIGEILTASDIKIVSPNDGLEPYNYDDILGTRLTADIGFEGNIHWEYVE